jgi:TusA-related sulfurtransferase
MHYFNVVDSIIIYTRKEKLKMSSKITDEEAMTLAKKEDVETGKTRHTIRELEGNEVISIITNFPHTLDEAKYVCEAIEEVLSYETDVRSIVLGVRTITIVKSLPELNADEFMVIYDDHIDGARGFIAKDALDYTAKVIALLYN